jgi:pyruvate-formate lyase-activating enzyme
MPKPDGLFITQLNVEIYGGCNYRCTSCPQATGREPEFTKNMPLDVFMKVIDDACQYGVTAISLHGSGEPTLHPELPKMIRYAKGKQGVHVSFFTHGKLLTEKRFASYMEAGLDLITVSIIGYDSETYRRWMTGDNFEKVLSNIEQCLRFRDQHGGKTEIHTRHLVIDLERKDWEVEQYRTNIINRVGCPSEIWMMHNWAALTSVPYSRTEEAARVQHAAIPARRTCGRPFAPYLEVRAGGLGGHNAAVVPCPIVLGQDSKAVMGHLDSQSIADVVGGKAYENLRKAHTEGRFDDISYCSGCDYLYPDIESLVWSNIPGRVKGQSKTSPALIYPSHAT